MNSKQRVNAVFSGSSYDRLPMWYGGDPETTKNIMNYVGARNEEEAMNSIGIDFKTFRPEYIGPEFKKYDDGSVETFWGVRREGYHYGQAVSHPLAAAESVEDITDYNWPKVEWWEVKMTPEQIEDSRDYCTIGGMWSPFFHDASDLVGTEKFLMDMILNPELVDALIENVFEYYYTITENAFKQNVRLIDMLFIGNDFGTQRSLMVSPQMWRKFFKARIKKFVELGHKYNLKTALHSCGDIHEIIPDLIDIGLDAINPIQVNAENMDPMVLKKKYGNDIVFFGGIDENEILAYGSEMIVREETRRIIDILGSDGRYIVAASHDYLLPEIPASNIVTMFDEAKKYSINTKIRTR